MPKVKKILLFMFMLVLDISRLFFHARHVKSTALLLLCSKIAESKGRIGSIILLGHEKELLYMLI